MLLASLKNTSVLRKSVSVCLEERKGEVLFLKGTTCLYSAVCLQRAVLFVQTRPVVAVKETPPSCVRVPRSLLLASPGFGLMSFRLLCFVFLHCGEAQTADSSASEQGQEGVLKSQANCEL